MRYFLPSIQWPISTTSVNLPGCSVCLSLPSIRRCPVNPSSPSKAVKPCSCQQYWVHVDVHSKTDPYLSGSTFKFNLRRFLQFCFTFSCSLQLSVSSTSCFCLYYYISPCLSVSPYQFYLLPFICPFFGFVSQTRCVFLSLCISLRICLSVSVVHTVSLVSISLAYSLFLSHKHDSFSVSALFYALRQWKWQRDRVMSLHFFHDLQPLCRDIIHLNNFFRSLAEALIQADLE